MASCVATALLARSLISFGSAGTLAGILMLIAAFVFYSQTTDLYMHLGHFVGGVLQREEFKIIYVAPMKALAQVFR